MRERTILKNIIIIFILSFLSFILMSLTPIETQQNKSFIEETYNLDINIANRSIFGIYIQDKKNYNNKLYIDKDNYKRLRKKLSLRIKQGTKSKTIENIDTKDILFYENKKYFIRYKIINYLNNEKKLFILSKTKTLKENVYFFDLVYNYIDWLFIFSGDDNLTNNYQVFNKIYLSNIYYLNSKEIISINTAKDFLENDLKYDILTDTYSKNEHKQNDYNLKISYYDYLQNGKIFNIDITTNKNINKYFITLSQIEGEQKINIFVSNEYLLTDEDFSIIKSLLFKGNKDLYLLNDTYSLYLADNYNIGNKYTISADLQDNKTLQATRIDFNVEIVKDSIFKNSSFKQSVEKSKDIFKKAIVYIITILIIIIILIIVLKLYKKFRR